MTILEEWIMFLKVMLILFPFMLGATYLTESIKKRREKEERKINDLKNRIYDWVDSLLPYRAVVWELSIYVDKKKELWAYVVIEVNSEEKAQKLDDYRKKSKHLDSVKFKIICGEEE